MPSLIWLRGLVAHRRGRLLATATGVAVAVTLLASIGSFLSSTMSKMTVRAAARVPVDWQVEGRAIGGRPHEGPNVFELGGWWWMLVDEWRGMGVHRSNDAVTWTRQGGADEVILGEPGHRRGDETFGRHGDVVVDGDRAVLYYFTHPHWDGSELGSSDAAAARLSAVFTAPLSVVDDRLVCDRDAPIDRNPS